MRLRTVFGIVGVCLLAASATGGGGGVNLDADGESEQIPTKRRIRKSRLAEFSGTLLSGIIGFALLGFLFIFFKSPAGYELDSASSLTFITAVGAFLVALSGFSQIRAHVVSEADSKRKEKLSERALALVFLGGLALALEPAVKVALEIRASLQS